MATEDCGHDMGGVWLPKAGGQFEYITLKCNKPFGHNHSIPESREARKESWRHSYFDYRSGMIVTRSQPPTVQVDPKGSIRAPS